MKWITTLITLALLCLMLPSVLAQEAGDGQICIRAFEDRNSNGIFDSNEPLITQGIGVNLLSALSVTIDAKLLEDSPNAGQGVICFQNLLAGDYGVLVTSADYSATTPTQFSALVVPQSVPTRFDFGGTVITTGANTSTTTTNTFTEEDQDRALQGILFGAIGAIVMVGVMVILGVFIYFAVFRRRMNRILAQSTGSFRPVTGAMPAYPSDTGQMPVMRPDTNSMPAVPANNPLLTRDPNEGSPPLFGEEDTDQMGAI